METAKHGGDVYRNRITCDFSVSLNPLGMPEAVREALKSSVDSWERYPDPECDELVRAIAGYHRVDPSFVLCGNGAADLIYQVTMAVRPKKALVTAPAFSEYEQALLAVGSQVVRFPLREDEGFAPDMDRFSDAVTEDTDLVFFCNPNNPTGRAARRSEVERLAGVCEEKNAVLVLDECFCDLMEKPERFSMAPLAGAYPGMFLIRAFTKTYAMAGLRLGYAICGNSTLTEKLRRIRQPWSVSIPAQTAGAAALKESGYLDEARALIRAERNYLKAGLSRLGFKVFESQANFLLFSDERERENKAGGCLWEQLKERGILIRDCGNFPGLGRGYYRVAVRRREENAALLSALAQIKEK